MIYLDNNTEPQMIFIPREVIDVEKTHNYYTREETDMKIKQIQNTTLDEVDDKLVGYATTKYVNDEVVVVRAATMGVEKKVSGYQFTVTDYNDGIPSAVELADRSVNELYSDLQNERNVNVSLFEYGSVTVNMQGCERGDDYCTIYFQDPTQFILVTLNENDIFDVSCMPISDIHGPSSVIINLSGNMNLPVDAFNRLHDAHQGGTAGILMQNNTVHSLIGSTDDSIILMGKDGLVIYTNTNGMITKTTMMMVDKDYVDDTLGDINNLLETI